MKLEFHINPSIPIESIIDSMQLDSGQTVAELKVDDYVITLEVCGHVRVQYNPDPNGKAEDGQSYRCASDFPEELMQIFAERLNHADMPNIYVDENNWFEIFLEKDGQFINSSTADYLESLKPDEVFSNLWDYYVENKKELEKNRGEPGTVIHGTHRNIDLIPAFKKELFSLDPERCRSFQKANLNMLEALCDLACGIESKWWESEEATETCNDLINILNDYAPSGHYFGTNEGDGSDFGYWEI